MSCSFVLDGNNFSEAQAFLSSFRGKDGAVRMTVSKTGVNLRLTEDGILGSCKLPIIATGSDDMYIKYSVLSNILSASRNGSVKIEVKDENLIQVTVDGVLLNLSPEFYNGIAFQLPDIEDPVEQVSIKAEKLAIIVKKIATHTASESQVTPVMKIGHQWRYGTSVNITLFNTEEFEDVNWTVSSSMLRFITNIAKLDQDVTFLHVHGEHENYLMVQSSYTTYWTTMAGMEPIDITEFMESDIQATSKWSKNTDISCSLEKLYIPLIGSVDEPHIIVTLGENKTKFLVTDLANRISFDVLEVDEQTAYNEAVELNFHAFANVMKKMDSALPFNVAVKETAVIFTQGDGTAGTLTAIISRFI